jgi:hypothetical protein
MIGVIWALMIAGFAGRVSKILTSFEENAGGASSESGFPGREPREPGSFDIMGEGVRNG